MLTPFEQLVLDMRFAQREFARFRELSLQSRARELEFRVDRALLEICHSEECGDETPEAARLRRSPDAWEFFGEIEEVPDCPPALGGPANEQNQGNPKNTEIRTRRSRPAKTQPGENGGAREAT